MQWPLLAFGHLFWPEVGQSDYWKLAGLFVNSVKVGKKSVSRSCVDHRQDKVKGFGMSLLCQCAKGLEEKSVQHVHAQ